MAEGPINPFQPGIRHFVSGKLPSPYRMLSFVDYPPNTRGVSHTHDGYQLLYFEEGDFSFEFEHRAPLKLFPGEVGVVTPGNAHVWVSAAESVTMAIIFDTGILERINDFAVFNSTVNHSPAWSVRMHDSEAGEIYKSIRRECSETIPFQSSLLAGRLTCFLAEVAKEARAAGLASVDLRLPEQIHTVLDYIEQHYQEDLTLEKMAGMAGLGVSRFSELFRTHTGVSPIQYAVGVRLTAAKSLLTYTDLPVNVIADHLGFNSLQYFSRIFKQHITVSPSIYREQQL